jgi:hypothetical protein
LNNKVSFQALLLSELTKVRQLTFCLPCPLAKHKIAWQFYFVGGDHMVCRMAEAVWLRLVKP